MECKIRAEHRHKSLLHNSGRVVVGGAVAPCSPRSVDFLFKLFARRLYHLPFFIPGKSHTGTFAWLHCLFFGDLEPCFLKNRISWNFEFSYGALLLRSIMNYCMPDMYEVPHAGMGGYTVQGSMEHCMYAGEGPGYGHCEPQPLHHPPCMEQTPWPPSQHYSCSYAGAPPVFKSEFCSMDIPLSHFHHQPEYFPGMKPDISHLQWMQGVHKRGTACRG